MDTAQHVDITALTAQMQNRIEAANAARQRHVLLKQEQIHANAHKQETKERFDRYRYRHLKQRSIWLLPLGGIFLLLSIPLFRFHFSLWGSVACGLGLLTLLFGVFLLVTYRKKHARMETEYADAIRKEEIASAALAEHQLTLDTCESTLNDITLQLKQSIGKKQQNDEIIRRKEELMRTLAPYGLSDWQDAGRLVESLIADFDAYNMSRAKLTAISQAAPSEKEQTLRQKLHAVQIEYARLDGILQTGAPPQSASQLENRIRDAEQEQQALQMKLKALREASEVLAESFAEMQQEFGAILSRETAQNLNRLTGGRYNYVTIDRSLNLKTRLPDSGAITADKLLSNGTIDQAYLALRLAITKLIAMQTGKSLPLFFDDSFIQYDDTRCEYAFRLVEELLDEPEFSQAVLFTCHSREARLTGEDMRG